MAARNPPSNGAGYPTIPENYGAIMSAPPDARYQQQQQQQQQYPQHQTTVPMEVDGQSGRYPDYQYNCVCQGYGGTTHSLQCQRHNQYMCDGLLQQRRPPPPPLQHNQAPPSGAVQDPVSGLRTDPGYEMKYMSDNNSNSNGGSHFAQEVDKHPAAHPEVVENVQPPSYAQVASASEDPTTKTHHDERQKGSEDSREYTRPQAGSNPDESYQVFHGCCDTPCTVRGQYYSTQGSNTSAPSQPHPERRYGFINNIVKSGLRTFGLGADSEQHEIEKSQSREAHIGSLKKERDELQRRFHDLEKSSREALKRKEEELRQVTDDRQSRVSSLRLELQQAKAAITTCESGAKAQDNQIVNLTSKMDEYKAQAERLNDQISSLEQSNSQAVGGTGAHKDSHAIPPNLLKASFAVKEAAFAFTKKFISYLKERKCLESHVALQTIREAVDDRYRKHAVEAYISKRLFAGFENDCYLDSLDFLQGARYLSSDFEVNEFFLHHQDLEQRRGRYLENYDMAQKLGLQGYLTRFKTRKAGSFNPFHRFCCRKLVTVMEGVDGFSKEFPPHADYSEHCLLYQLATEPKFCDQILKPFMTLALAAYLLHRLAFQFNPAARIFRFARGVKFDKNYMENAFPIDDDMSDEGLIVGLMLSPGFQVGATIAKCKVYLVPESRTDTGSGSDRVK